MVHTKLWAVVKAVLLSKAFWKLVGILGATFGIANAETVFEVLGELVTEVYADA
ncbi:hypothetical protein SRABI89_05308 [Pseudomonas koreensis]|jgi:hypothetical protein|nr:hypothetical protein SRABI89_05308 [Pseudomonas koreensis]